jgi:hypothetical protein
VEHDTDLNEMQSDPVRLEQLNRALADNRPALLPHVAIGVDPANDIEGLVRDVRGLGEANSPTERDDDDQILLRCWALLGVPNERIHDDSPLIGT